MPIIRPLFIRNRNVWYLELLKWMFSQLGRKSSSLLHIRSIGPDVDTVYPAHCTLFVAWPFALPTCLRTHPYLLTYTHPILQTIPLPHPNTKHYSFGSFQFLLGFFSNFASKLQKPINLFHLTTASLPHIQARRVVTVGKSFAISPLPSPCRSRYRYLPSSLFR